MDENVVTVKCAATSVFHDKVVDTLTGAQAEVTLRERARSLRDAQLASAQGKAGERSQTMVIAQLLLGVGFILFVLYPPISNFMTAL